MITPHPHRPFSQLKNSHSPIFLNPFILYLPHHHQTMPTTLAVGRCDYGGTGGAESIKLFSFDESDGSATPAGEINTKRNPSWVTADPARKVLHCTGENAPHGSLQSFPYPKDLAGEWTPSSQVDVSGAPCHISLIGDTIVSANYMGGNISVVKEGTLLETHTTEGRLPENPSFQDRQEGPHPHHIEIVDGSVVAVSDLGFDTVTVMDSAGGDVKKVISMGEGRGPRRVLLRNGLLYSMNELDNTLSVVTLEGRFVQESVPLMEDQARSLRKHHRGGSEIAFSPCGGFLVAATRSTNEFVVFSVAENGALQFLNRISSVCTTPRHILFIGNWFLASCHIVSDTLHPEPQRTDCVAVFKFEAGVLSFVSEIPCPFASCVAVL